MKGNDSMSTSVIVALLIVIVALVAGIGVKHSVEHSKNSNSSCEVSEVPDFFVKKEEQSLDDYEFSFKCWYSPASHSAFGPEINECIAVPYMYCELMKTLEGNDRMPLIDNDGKVYGGLERDTMFESGIIMYDFGVYDKTLEGYYGIYAFTYDLKNEYVGIACGYNTYGVMMTGDKDEGTRLFNEECYGDESYEEDIDIDKINSQWQDWVMKCVIYRATMLMNEGA